MSGYRDKFREDRQIANSTALYLTAFSLLFPSANAVERTSMNAGMATEMQNAYSVPFQHFQLQTVFRGEDRGGEGIQYRLQPS